MRKIILAIGFISLLVSCGSKTTGTENEKETTDEVEVKEEKKDFKFTSYKLLNAYNGDKESFLASLKGKTITITDVLIKFGNTGEISGEKVLWGEAPGYMKSHSSQIENHYLGYSNPNAGVKKIVDGDEMPEYKEVPQVLILEGTKIDESVIITEYDSKKEGEIEFYTYHTLLTIKVSGDLIAPKGEYSLKISQGEVIESRNF